MAHEEQLRYISLVRECFVPASTMGLRILEIGSYDVNGSVRKFFPESVYTGVDLCAGPGVDLVGFGHEVALPARASTSRSPVNALSTIRTGSRL